MFRNIVSCIRLFWGISKKDVLRLFALTGLHGLLAPLILILLQRSIDVLVLCLQAKQDFVALLFPAGLVVAAVLLGNVCGFFSERIKNSLQSRSKMKIAKMVLGKYVVLPFPGFEDPAVLDDIQAMHRDPSGEIFQVFALVLSLLSSAVEFAGIAVVLCRYSPRVFLLYLVAVTAVMAFHFCAVSRMNRMMDSQTTDERKLTDLERTLSEKDSAYDLHVNNGVAFIGGKINVLLNRVLRERLAVTVRAQGWSALAYLFSLIWMVASVAILAFQYQKGQVSMGGFTAVVSSLSASLALAEGIAVSFSRLLQCNRIVRHFNAFLLMPEENEEKEAGSDRALAAFDPDKPVIEFRHVGFAYPVTKKRILHDVTFRVMRGEKIGLVGLNGCGKTTLIQLLLRVYQPDEGEILLCGCPLNSLSRREIQSVFTVVPQDYGHYALTVRENVALSDLTALSEDVRIREALSEVRLEGPDWTPDRPLGTFQENGIDLSGGQWQRLALARALFSTSGTLLLDEPTASLDPIAEARFFEELSPMLKRRGAVLVTHRLSNVRNADCIFLLAEGTVAECGTHEELMEKRGLYWEMYEKQASWYKREEAEIK